VIYLVTYDENWHKEFHFSFTYDQFTF